MTYDSWKATDPRDVQPPLKCPECLGVIDEREGCGCNVEPDCPACLHPDSECTCDSHLGETDDDYDSDYEDCP